MTRAILAALLCATQGCKGRSATKSENGLVLSTALAALLCATAAGAETRREWHGGPVSSWAEIHAPTAPGAVASVTFHDQPVHTSADTFTLTLDGLTIGGRIEHMGAVPGERLHLTAPDGYFVWPEVLEPGETRTDTAHVYPLGVAS